jgi:lysophospholipase L1-like esterase
VSRARKSWVLLAGLLLAACTSPSANSPVIAAAAGSENSPFARELAAFAAEDRLALRPACLVVFTGSSSIRLWRSLGDDMAPLNVLNRGFGGSQIADVNRHFQEVVGRHRPQAIVFYAGENDLAAGKSPDTVAADFETFLALKTQALGRTPVYFVSIKPSAARWAQLPRQQRANELIRGLAGRRTDLHFIDVTSAMLQEGAPKDIFIADRLHMTPQGYALWTPLVRAALFKEPALRRTACRRS